MSSFYPSKPIKSKEIKKVSNVLNKHLDFENINLEPLTPFCDNAPIKKFIDGWQNEVANLNVNNSVMQYSHYLQERISYTECASLYTDDWINRAITLKTNDLINKRGEFIIKNQNVENGDTILNKLNEKLDKLYFWSKLRELIEKSYIFGGAFLYLDFDGDYNIKIPCKYEFIKDNPIKDFKIVEPWVISPYDVNMTNPLSNDYMTPKQWFINGAGKVDNSRLLSLVFHKIPNIYKPMYNFLGIGLTQIMRDYIKQVKSMIASSSDLFLRFRTMIIKTDLLTTDPEEAIARAKANNKTMNNLGIYLLNGKEEFIESITPISGLYDLLDRVSNLVGASGGIPLFKLFGTSVGGGLNSGESELKQYYDEIESIQNAILKPVVSKIGQMILWGLGYNLELDFNFNPIAQESNIEKSQRENLNVDLIMKLLENNVIDTEQAFKMAQQKEIIPLSDKYLANNDEVNNIDENELKEFIKANVKTE